VALGRLAVPQRGGHTEDFGFDVLIHFHGAEPVRKALVPIARGLTFVGIDVGQGSGAYDRAVVGGQAWPALLASIEQALRAHAKTERAHIRHLGVSGWSAGYGAVVRLLAENASRIEAVLLLDGLHASWARERASGAVRGDSIQPIVPFARRALKNEALFVLTHSEIEPEAYPSVQRTADWLLAELGVRREAVANAASTPFALKSQFQSGGFQVLGYSGRDRQAHCRQVSLIGDMVSRILEPRWNTPALDRSVPNTPAPPPDTREAQPGALPSLPRGSIQFEVVR
jgi:hypothetical protein